MTASYIPVHIPRMDTSLIARGATPIDLDKPRLLFFDMQATAWLQAKFGDGFPRKLYTAEKVGDEGYRAKLVDVEVLHSFLWIGLQAGARESREEITPQMASDWIMPSTLTYIFERTIIAFTRSIHTPAAPGESGKADAAAARPAAVAKPRTARKASITRRPSVSRSPSSGKRPPSSGRKR